MGPIRWFMALALKADHFHTRRRPSLACALPRHRPRPRRDRVSPWDGLSPCETHHLAERPGRDSRFTKSGRAIPLQQDLENRAPNYFGNSEISLANRPKSAIYRSRPVPREGRCARHERGAGCGGRWQRARRARPAGVRPSRVVLTPQCRRQVCEKKRRRRCQTSMVTGESAK